jgi:glucose-1-phosphate thymidylyltransferase
VNGEHAVERTSCAAGGRDTGRLGDMLATNRLILETVERRVEGELADTLIEGRVVVEPRATRPRDRPRSRGDRRRRRGAYVGPYTAIGRHCVIEEAEIEHPILLEGFSVRPLNGRMESSLLGHDVSISRTPRQSRAYRFMVGDSSEIGIL